LTGWQFAGHGHLDLNFFSGSDVPRQRGAAQVFPQDLAGRIA
jgi:hypothetical protein